MALNLSIKGVPESLAAQLRSRAERHHRSLQGELMAIIERAAAEGAEPAAASARAGGLSIERIGAALRTRFPLPVDAPPRAVDVVRELRDTR